ncbi:DUF4190 domain-containing protein [Nocardioides humilatus]|uniref:DUF4190 domain-containing protein n=1 Tax=Nocardioides humilatus TaxID=2607660 RepID=A0A5B1LFX1_9ACTN|nr:DUF4190 domain-containing protein [Nocardioides humilatus]KAA1418680.1 DUF4190 domain-containing protein [Nocardioides humilatus]
MSNPYGNDPYGQQPANPYGAGGAPGGSFEQPKTDGVSIAALVTSLICCAPVGVILGFVGISRTKNGQRKGRGLAITGLVVGLIGTLVWVGIGIAAIAGVAWFDSLVLPDEAKVGQCIDVTEDDGDVLMYEKECSEKHDAEIVAVAKVDSDNQDAINEAMTGYCVGLISDEDAVKLTPYLGADFGNLKAVIEHPNGAKVGDHLVCYIEPDDKLDKSIL